MKEEIKDIVRRLAAGELTDQEKSDYRFGRKYRSRNMPFNASWPIAKQVGWIYTDEIRNIYSEVGNKFVLNEESVFVDTTFPIGIELICNGPVFLKYYGNRPLEGAMSFTFPDGTSRYLLEGTYSKVV